MKLAIFGGTFNPIHNGHIALAQAGMNQLGLDKVLFIPAYIPPHKQSDFLASAEDRYNMVKLAVEGFDNFEVLKLEINRRSVSYSIDTVKYIKMIYPDNAEIFFLIGSDMLIDLDKWKNIDKLSGLVKFAAGVRPGHLIKQKYDNVEIMPLEPVDISSTQIREMIRADRDISSFIPESVDNYIKENNIYK